MKDLIAAALKSTYDTRSPGGVERCIDLLIRLKSMSLSAKDILYFSKSIFKLETLRRHRNPRIREVSHSLLTSLLKTLYSQGSDKSAGLNAVSLKRKEANTGSLTNKRAKTNLLVSDQKQDHKTLAREPVVRRTETKKTDACMSVTTTALPQQSRRDIKDALLQLWRQRIREEERKESSAIKNPRKAQGTCGKGFTRESTNAMKLSYRTHSSNVKNENFKSPNQRESLYLRL
ncbi:BnaA05g35170D [Brassica napus]|uniref:BnaA05g35170D protein n=1 Tax=Brassica napus TaxID=3708 RepID=A0A078J537_BRANA|nr:BnaA05g35170D [Brassica napus]